MIPRYLVLGPARWPQAPAVALSAGTGGGKLAPFNVQTTTDNYVGVLIEADLVSNPTYRLFINIDGPADESTARYALANGQSIFLTLNVNNLVHYHLVDTSNVETAGGAHDYLRVSAYYVPG